MQYRFVTDRGKIVEVKVDCARLIILHFKFKLHRFIDTFNICKVSVEIVYFCLHVLIGMYKKEKIIASTVVCFESVWSPTGRALHSLKGMLLVRLGKKYFQLV